MLLSAKNQNFMHSQRWDQQNASSVKTDRVMPGQLSLKWNDWCQIKMEIAAFVSSVSVLENIC